MLFIFWNQVEFINKARINIFMIEFSSSRTWNVFLYIIDMGCFFPCCYTHLYVSAQFLLNICLDVFIVVLNIVLSSNIFFNWIM